ncbi:gustatory receptor for sugar taste 64e-like [Oratosquilla oratoria]|uniref:gustatory receptor for sugar taste 64e-like n=1 Tax=Oratosquilla oratoria TaxID=337810 RepID=UPI003F75AED9
MFTHSTFYSLNAVGTLLFIWVAHALPEVLKGWQQMEYELGHLYPPTSAFRSVVVLTSVVMVSAVGETVTSMFYNVSLNSTSEFWEYLECYLRAGHQYEVNLLGYSNGLGLFTLVVNKYATFFWNFIDVFISVVAIILKTQFNDFNKFMDEGRGRIWTNANWRSAREGHLTLQQVVLSVDQTISPAVLHSYVTNLFFILVQLYFGLKFSSQEDVIPRVYLVWSFLHLVGRFMMVSLTCSALNEQSKKSVHHLLEVPSESYSMEVWRFGKQMAAMDVGLSGWGFFLVNKNFVLGIQAHKNLHTQSTSPYDLHNRKRLEAYPRKRVVWAKSVTFSMCAWTIGTMWPNQWGYRRDHKDICVLR